MTMDFREMIAADINILQSRFTTLFKTSRNRVHLAFLKQFSNAVNSFQHEYQSVLKEFELRTINFLVVRNVHKCSCNTKIGLWIEEINDFIYKFEDLKRSLAILQSILESSCRLVYHLYHDNHFSFEYAQDEKLTYLLDRLKSLTGWLNLEATGNDNSKPTGVNSHDVKYRFKYSTLIEALDLHRDCYQSSYCPIPINEKCLSIQNLQCVHYTDRINQDIQRTWNLLCDCYWLVLTSKLSEMNAYLSNINSEWTEKNVTSDIQSPHCYALTRRCNRIIYNLLQQLLSYPTALSVFNSNKDCLSEMYNNLSIMIKYANDKSIIAYKFHAT
uniref:Uncharacterized protein n=1 Tax=Trichobilharzia regenti TaxID=157069 RepID=A0AA85JNN7_TRIRE|nr:unnamed protein product [Trichobilharzia regenti]